MLALITLPNPSDLMTNIGNWSTAMFSEFLGVAELIIGISLAGILIAFIISITITAGNKLLGRKD